MANLIPPFLASAFERMGASNKSIEQVAINTGQTAASVSVGGDLYTKIDELCKALDAGGKGGKGTVSVKEALVLRITAGSLKPIGLGLGVIIDALDRAPDGKELKLKMEALTNGLLALADIGYSILKFAATMILATPLLLVAGVASLIWVPMLWLMIKGLMFATKKLDKKALKNILILGDIGKALLLLSVSLVLMALLTPQILKGMLVAGAVLLGFAVIGMILDKMGVSKSLGKMGKMLTKLALGLFTVSLTLILIGLLTPFILKGLATAGLVILGIAGIFWLIDKMQIDKSMRKTSRALIMAAGAILSVTVALVLSSLIVSSLGAVGVAKTIGVVLLVAGLFWLLDKMQIDKAMRKTAFALMAAAGAILAITISIVLSSLMIGMVGWKEVAKILLITAGIGLVFTIIGAGASSIMKGAGAMALAGLSLIVLSFGVKMLNNAVPSGKEALKMLLLIGGLALVFGVIGLAGVNIALGAAAMLIVGLSMISLGIGLMVFMSTIPSLDQVIKIGLVIAGLAVEYAIIGLASPLILLGAVAMTAVGVSLIVLGPGIFLLMKATENVKPDNALMAGLIIGGLAVVFAAAGLASPLIILGAAAMLIAGAATIVLAGALALLSLLDFKSLGTLSQKGGKAFDWSGERGFFGGKKTNFETAMDAIADGMSLNPLSIYGIMTGAPVLLLAGTAMIAIAGGIKAFSGILDDIDLPSLSVNMRLITSALADTFAEVGTKYPGGGGSFLSALTGDTSGQSVVAQGISAVSGMGTALTGIAKGVQAMAMLKFPTGFDKDGNPTGFQTIDLKTAVPALIANTREIVRGLSEVFSEVGNDKAAQGSSWFSSSTYEKGINVVKQMGDPLFNLANGVQAMANLKFPTGYDKDGKATGYKSIGDVGTLVQKLSKNTKALIKGLSGVFEEIGAGDTNKDGGWFTSSSFEKGIEIATMLGEPYSGLASTVEDALKITSKITDVEVLKATIQGMIDAITGGEQDIAVISVKKDLIREIGSMYTKLSTAIPPIVDSLSKFTTEKGIAFANVFGGSTPPDMLEAKNKMFRVLSSAYLKMATAIPTIVGALNTTDSEQLSAFTGIYGGSMDVDPGTLTARTTLFSAVGSSYQKIGAASTAISSAITGANAENLTVWKDLFIGPVSFIRPIAGYEAQTELWNAIGGNITKTGSAMPEISSAINSMDMAKLIEARTMFEALGVLANGGAPSDILATMGESLEEALENLAEMIEQFKTSVTEGAEDNRGLINKVTDAVGLTGGGSSSSSSSSSSTPSIKFPDTMKVTLDRSSINAIKGSNNMGGGR